jgi:hypothetical protein
MTKLAIGAAAVLVGTSVYANAHSGGQVFKPAAAARVALEQLAEGSQPKPAPQPQQPRRRGNTTIAPEASTD